MTDCTTVVALRDNRLENAEILSFTLETSDPDVIVGINSITRVTITDETSENSYVFRTNAWHTMCSII